MFSATTSEKFLTISLIDAANNFIKDQLQGDAEFFSQEVTSSALGDKIFTAIILTRSNVQRNDKRKIFDGKFNRRGK